ncbi:orotidine-5'-phosphate decarboxylase [Olsenella sp. YH-ols2217]|uniref:Orotidine 5'-phosphate decarboxylase n=1 Tax=Kribbibacterium absianum TaxID=3044210 RepID=A0ABT6ZIL8_9ACTN|nr:MULTISPECIES: orotidine-5'-phosphate decarboxylase [unclassified Olsenella]MDJ1121407.1 orotidine-5'-phosphate decarboxylase [Olsenella sp. YH-ols2216]MDJ1128897.1 orotidine-5'-phosphate decarboxylase [Olsenella sp. YH-ols2217]
MLEDRRAEAADRVIVALDCDRTEAVALAHKLAGKARWVKVGMTLFYAEGPSIVDYFRSQGFKVFLDLKLFDIPHQVRGAAASAVATGADILSIHGLGGADMVQAARAGADSCDRDVEPRVIAITVLTSMSQGTLETIGVGEPLTDEVKRLATLACTNGADGVVCSPNEAAMLRELLGPDALIVTPGVRPTGAALGDQSRVATPAGAIKAGASHLVVGRPITAADDPVATFDAIVDEVAEAL